MPSKPKCVSCNEMPVFFTEEEMCRSCGIALGFDTIPTAPAVQPPAPTTPKKKQED